MIASRGMRLIITAEEFGWRISLCRGRLHRGHWYTSSIAVVLDTLAQWDGQVHVR